MSDIHGTRAAYNAGCRCAECRQAQANGMRRYRAGERSLWGQGRRPNAKTRAVALARVAYESLTRDRGGWSEFDTLVEQEPIAALGEALAEISEDGPPEANLGQQMVTKGGRIARDMEQYIERGSTGPLPAALLRDKP